MRTLPLNGIHIYLFCITLADIVIATLLAVLPVTYSVVLDKCCHPMVATLLLVVAQPVETHVHCFVLRRHVGLPGLLGLTSVVVPLHVHRRHLVRAGLVCYLDHFPKNLPNELQARAAWACRAAGADARIVAAACALFAFV